MENKTLEKVLDVAGSTTKIMANLSEVKKDKSQDRKNPDDNSNNAATGNQSVQISLDSGKRKDPKPVEKHIHTFPEARPLTTEECDLDLKKAQMDFELRKNELTYSIERDKRYWNYKIAKEKKEERKHLFRKIVGGVLIGLGIGGGAYCYYLDYKRNKNAPIVKPAPVVPEEPEPVKAEGTVE